MNKKIDLKKKIYSKEEYKNTIDTNFTQLGKKSVPETLDSEVTVNKFFKEYNELFYEIPALGETNSHEFLIKTSSDYIDFEPNQEEIEALQNEISILRRQLLELQTQTAGITGSIGQIDDSELQNTATNLISTLQPSTETLDGITE
jgi:aconitase A|tara:strand:+ start:1628 stop:2065 length:438 start_codon:yes stop_codon:yes gene_type:complete